MTRARWAPRLRRLLVGIAGLALLGGAALVPSVPETDAAWTDAELGMAQFTAATLAPPVIEGPISPCRSVLLGGEVVGVRWAFPSELEPYSGFNASNVQWRVAGGAWQSAPTSGPDAEGYYTTTFTQGVLDGLLGSLLGGSFTADVRTRAYEHWASSGVSTVSYRANILGVLLPPTCTFTNGT